MYFHQNQGILAKTTTKKPPTVGYEMGGSIDRPDTRSWPKFARNQHTKMHLPLKVSCPELALSQFETGARNELSAKENWGSCEKKDPDFLGVCNQTSPLWWGHWLSFNEGEARRFWAYYF